MHCLKIKSMNLYLALCLRVLGRGFICTSALGGLVVLAVVSVDLKPPQAYFLYFRGGEFLSCLLFSPPLSFSSLLCLREAGEGLQPRDMSNRWFPQTLSLIRHLTTNLIDKLDRQKDCPGRCVAGRVFVCLSPAMLSCKCVCLCVCAVLCCTYEAPFSRHLTVGIFIILFLFLVVI